MLAILLALLLGADQAAQLQSVELSCKASGKGRLEGCKVVADRCEGAGYARRALQLARQAKVDPADYPGSEPVQVLIPCAQIPPPALRPPRGGHSPGPSAAERQRCHRPGGAGVGMPC